MEVKANLESLIYDINNKSGPGLNNGFLTAYDNFTWLSLREIVLKNTFSGILFSMVLSFLVMVVATRSPHISIIAIVAISAIIGAMLSAIRLQDG